MATRRRSTAIKSAKAATTVETVTITPSVVTKVTKYSKPIEIKKVTETPTPARVRPEKPNLSFEDYKADAQVRWQIHQYATQELWNDLVKGYNFAKPIVVKSIDYVKDSYNRAFEVKETEAAD